MATGPLARIATELYALAPEDFTAARDAAVKQARGDGDRDLADEVKALRRPPVSAWLANLLVRERADDIDDLLALGGELREAQDALDGAALRTMTRQRQEVVHGLSTTARQLAGKPVADAALRELEATLDAALADESAATALRSGRLMRALSSTGLEAVDLSGAVAAPEELPAPLTERQRATARLPKPAAGRRPPAKAPATKATATKAPATEASPTKAAAKKAATKKAAAKRAADSAAAERAEQLAQAQAALDRATAELDTADGRLADARATVAAIDAELADLQAKLDDAGDRRASAERERRDADTARKAAARARDAAQRAVATARTRAR